MDITISLKTARQLWLFFNTSNCGRNGPHNVQRKNGNYRQPVRCVADHYLWILKIGRGDQKNIALTVSLPETQNDTEDGGKRKGDPGKKARLVVPSFLY